MVAFPYQNLHDNAANDLVTQTGAYDVIDVAGQWDGEFAPYLVPLNDCVERDGISGDDFIPNIWQLNGLWEGQSQRHPERQRRPRHHLPHRSLRRGRRQHPRDLGSSTTRTPRALTGDGIFGASWTGLGEQLQGSWLSRYWESGQPLCDEDWRPAFVNEAGVNAIELLRDALPVRPRGDARVGTSPPT